MKQKTFFIVFKGLSYGEKKKKNWQKIADTSFNQGRGSKIFILVWGYIVRGEESHNFEVKIKIA